MFDITRRDLAWGTGIACAIASVVFFLVLNNLVSLTAKDVADKVRSQTHAAHGTAERPNIIEWPIVVRRLKGDREFDEAAGDAADAAEAASKRLLALGK